MMRATWDGCLVRLETWHGKKHINPRWNRKLKSVVFVSKYNPRAPDINRIFKQHLDIIEGDEKAFKVLPKGSIRAAFNRGANLKELLAPSNPYKNFELASQVSGCFKCTAKRCDCCASFLIEGDMFSSSVTKRKFKIRQKLTCTSENVIYLAVCIACRLSTGSSFLMKATTCGRKFKLFTFLPFYLFKLFKV